MNPGIKHDMEEAVDFLYGLPKFTTKNSLDHTRKLLALLGDPCFKRKIIHVAGSNGKGSVCCFLYHMLLAGGKTAALFTSPHLIDIRERFQMNGGMVPEEEFLEGYRRVRSASAELVRNNLNHPTFFEFIFALGMVLFERAQTEYIVLETGLGGRLDATNSFPTPLLSVITSISLEHTEILGGTLAQIAAEKAGILKPGVPLVFFDDDGESADVIRRRASALGCPQYPISKKMFQNYEIKEEGIDFSLSTAYDKSKRGAVRWTVPGHAVYQIENAALAITAMRVLDLMDDAVIQRGLSEAKWPGRMQEVVPEIYFDGAHNPSGIAAFIESVRVLTKDDGVPPLLLFSMVKEKDLHAAADLLTASVAWDAIAVTTVDGERGVPAETLRSLFFGDGGKAAACPVDSFADSREAFTAMRRRKKPGQKLFCTGSLYFVGELLRLIS
ncbi:MAG: bifunctional folylpolyglutamate synthase/dihydrofolate synthase [Clostridiales bacterium]|nr:bifunctional folylpolyglutamate synthase/dihydrofolate synthase [Clostridiales bacterium]